MGLILDTNFVITAEQEAKSGRGNSTDLFLIAHDNHRFFIALHGCR